jgi:hypothetical protein
MGRAGPRDHRQRAALAVEREPNATWRRHFAVARYWLAWLVSTILEFWTLSAS